MRESISSVLGVQGWGRRGSGLLRTACSADPEQGTGRWKLHHAEMGKWIFWGRLQRAMRFPYHLI